MIARRKRKKDGGVCAAVSVTLASTLGLTGAGLTSAQEHEHAIHEMRDRETPGPEAQAVLDKLVAARDALRRIGRPDEAEALSRVIDELHERMHAAHPEVAPVRERADRVERIERAERVERAERGERIERADQPMDVDRERVEQQLHVLELALNVYGEFGWERAAERTESALNARRAMLNDRDDPEAREWQERAPRPEETFDLLVQAERVAREHGRMDRANEINRLTEAAFRRDRPEPEASPRNEALARDIEIMQMAVHGLAEAERRDAAELLERAVRARRMDLEGRRDPESMEFREQAPGPEDQIEFLMRASHAWREFAQPRRADAIEELANRMRERLGRGRAEGAPAPERQRAEELMDMHRELAEQLRNMQEQMRELERMMDRLAQQIREREQPDRERRR